MINLSNPVSVHRGLDTAGIEYVISQGKHKIGHVPALTLRDVRFVVDIPKRRVSRVGTRRVHAWATGVLELAPRLWVLEGGRRASYSPFTDVPAFSLNVGGYVKAARVCVCTPQGLFVHDPELYSEAEIATLKRKA